MESLSALVERGASLSPIKSRQPPLLCAASLGHVSMVERLVALGVHVDSRDALGDSALHCAAAANHFRLVKALLRLGADPHARNAKGLTPRDVARSPLVSTLLETHVTLTPTLTPYLTPNLTPSTDPLAAASSALAQRLDDGKGPAHLLASEGEAYALERLLASSLNASTLVALRDKVLHAV